MELAIHAFVICCIQADFACVGAQHFGRDRGPDRQTDRGGKLVGWIGTADVKCGPYDEPPDRAVALAIAWFGPSGGSYDRGCQFPSAIR
jgi:hypothetical protein